MTIRDYIKRRARWGFGIAIAAWLVVAISGNMGFRFPGARFVAIGGAFGFMGAILSFLFIRCPKCRARLGQTIAMPTALRFSRWSPQVNYCPYCGVSLDEPIPPAPYQMVK